MGELHITAETIDNKGKRRPITLDPIREATLSIPAREVESTIPCGLQFEWGKGTYGPLKFNMASGAGVGSRWLTFHVDGHDYCINADDIAKALLDFHTEKYPITEPPPEIPFPSRRRVKKT